MNIYHTGPSRRAVLAASALAPVLMTVTQALAQGTAPKRGGTLNALLTPEPPVLVLGVNSQGPTLVCASKIYQGLLRYLSTLEPLLELAKSWELSDPACSLLLRERAGMREAASAGIGLDRTALVWDGTVLAASLTPALSRRERGRKRR